MGGKDREQTIQNIKNEITTTVKNINEQIANITNKSINSISNTYINSEKNNVDVKSAATNYLELVGVTIGEGAYLQNQQKADVSVITQAVMNLQKDTEAQTNMMTDITNDITTKIKNDNNLSSQMDAVNKLLMSNNVEGEINNIVDKVAKTADNAVNALTGRSVDKNTEQNAINTIRNAVINETHTETNINNIIENYFNTKVENLSASNCIYVNAAANQAIIRNTIIAPGARIINNQVAAVSALNDCIISSFVKNSDVKDMVFKAKSASETDVANSTTVENKMKVQNTITSINKTGSIITGLLSAMMFFFVIGIIILIVFFAMSVKGSFKAFKTAVKVSTFGAVDIDK